MSQFHRKDVVALSGNSKHADDWAVVSVSTIYGVGVAA